MLASESAFLSPFPPCGQFIRLASSHNWVVTVCSIHPRAPGSVGSAAFDRSAAQTESPGLRRRSDYGFAVPIVLSPFLFYLDKTVFDLGDVAATAGAVLAAGAGFAIAGRRGAGRSRLLLSVIAVTAIALLVAMADLSVIRRSGAAAQAGGGNSLPVYSFDGASGNPHAFIAWWTKYVTAWEQVRLAIETQRVDGGRHVPIPDRTARFLDGEVHINNLGFRGRDIPPEKGDDFRIFTMGASNVFGQNIFPDSVPWPAVLDRMIAERLDCRRPVQVINAGVNAYDLRKSLARLTDDIAPLQPDMLISYTGWAEIKYIFEDLPKQVNKRFAARLLADLQRGDVETGFPLVTFNGRRYRFDLLRGLRLFQARIEFAAAQFGNRLAGLDYAARRLFGESEGDGLDTIRNSELGGLYRDLVAEAQRLGARLVLTSNNLAIDARSPQDVLGFYASVFHNNMPGTTYLEAVMRGLDLNRRLLQELATQNSGVEAIDVAAGLEGEFDADYYIDIAHFTPKGDRRMAENVFNGIAPMLRSDPSLACRNR